jgi:hypothetical protein
VGELNCIKHFYFLSDLKMKIILTYIGALIALAALVTGALIENQLYQQDDTPEVTATPPVTPQPTPTSSPSPSTTPNTTTQKTKDYFATIEIKSPNNTLNDAASLNLDVSVEYYTFTHTNGPVEIPYQDFKCVYQVDDGEWREATIFGDISKNWVMSLVNNGGWTTVFCNYTCSLTGLPNGLHLVNITTTPSDMIWSHESYTGSLDCSIFLGVQDQRVFCCQLLMPENVTGGNPHILDYIETRQNAPSSWMTYSLDGQANVTLTKESKMPAVSDSCHFITVYAADNFGTETRTNTVWFSVES